MRQLSAQRRHCCTHSSTRTGVAVIGFGLVIAFYILREHYEHALGALPYLLLLACPLMHLFMHHGHGGHAGHGQADERPRIQGGAP